MGAVIPDLGTYAQVVEAVRFWRRRCRQLERQRRRSRRGWRSTAGPEAAKYADVLAYLDSHGGRYFAELDALVRGADERGALTRARQLREARIILLAAGYAAEPRRGPRGAIERRRRKLLHRGRAVPV
jgi:hypothetical protein